MLLIIITFLIIVIVYLSIRLFILSKEIKGISQQLSAYNKFSTEKKIDVNLLDKNIEQLGEEINLLMSHYISIKREKIKSEQELKQTVANISHDLRTPLTSIKGYIQVLQKEDIEQTDRKEYFSILKKRASHLEGLINDFFELSKIESNDFQLENEEIEIVRLVNENILSFYNNFVDAGIEPTINIEAQSICINSDISAVNRVVENLISNALSYSDGEISINLDHDHQFVYLSVENSVQIHTPDDELEQFFDRFYTADKSRSGQSTGLGLSIVKSLMEKMNGKTKLNYEDKQFRITCQWPLEE